MSASLPFRPIPPRPRRPTLGAALVALSYAVPAMTLLGMMVHAHQTTFGRLATTPLSRDTGEIVQSVLLALVLIGVMVASRRGFKYGAALRQRNAIELVETDGRAPVLYLRSFDDDAAPDYTGSVLPFGAKETIEMRLAVALHSAGPVISIGRPGERLPELGSSRFYVTDEEWQQAVRYFLDRSAAVVILVGRSIGVTWEIMTALREVPRERLLFVFPYLLPHERRTRKQELVQWLRSTRTGAGDSLGKELLSRVRAEREARYGAFRRNFGRYLGTDLPAELGSSLFLDYLEDGSPRLIPTRQPLFVRRMRDRQGITIDYARTLRSFLEKLLKRTILPDRVERLLTSRAGLRAVTGLCGAIALVGFSSPFTFGLGPLGFALFFLTWLPANFVYWGVWNLVRDPPHGASLRAEWSLGVDPSGHAPMGGGAPAYTSPATSLVATARLIYGLLALGLLLVIPGIVAVLVAYAQRSKAQGTFLELHFRWQLRTFWFWLLWFVSAVALTATAIGALVGVPLAFGTYLWAGYRIVRGWRALGRQAPVFPSRGLGG